MIQRSSRKRPFVALFIIIIICWLGYTIIYEGATKVLFERIRFLKHALNFIWLVLIGIIGFWGLSVYNQGWIKKIWLIIYSAIAIFMLLLGVVDLYVIRFSTDVKDAVAMLRFFFQSPMPFMLLCFLGSKANSMNNTQNTNDG